MWINILLVVFEIESHKNYTVNIIAIHPIRKYTSMAIKDADDILNNCKYPKMYK